jgi:hypothetical protein
MPSAHSVQASPAGHQRGHVGRPPRMIPMVGIGPPIALPFQDPGSGASITGLRHAPVTNGVTHPMPGCRGRAKDILKAYRTITIQAPRELTVFLVLSRAPAAPAPQLAAERGASPAR